MQPEVEFFEEPVSPSQKSLSQSVLQIPWEKILPLNLGNGTTVELTTFDKVAQFLEQNWQDIQSELGNHPFMFEKLSEKKRRYYQLASDFFAFKKEGQTIGICIGSTLDWATYYIRYVWIRPECRRAGSFSTLITAIANVCRQSGVERIDVHVSPSNIPGLLMYQKLLFNNVGYEVSERWGALVKLSKMLKAENEDLLLNQFFMGPKYQVEARAENQQSTQSSGDSLKANNRPRE